MNCQQIWKISRKRLNRSENIPKSIMGTTFLKHPVYKLHMQHFGIGALFCSVAFIYVIVFFALH